MRGFSSLAVFGLLLLGASVPTEVGAQTGPLEPRMVLASMPTPVPKPALNVTLRVPLNMAISADGRVTNVEILESSGDAKFDEKVKKYYSRFRFVPALDDNGTPTPSVFRFAYKYTVDGENDPPHTPTRAPENPNSALVGRPAIGQSKVFDEVDRISRMRCKDFLWEYDLMKDIAGAKPVYDERILRTSLAMFIVHKSVKGDELNTINIAFSESVREAVNQCRKQPDAKYFLDVLAPALETKLKR